MLFQHSLKFQDEMKMVKGKGKFYALECDISKEEDVTKAFNWVKTNLGCVNVLVNSAGILVFGPIIGITMY